MKIKLILPLILFATLSLKAQVASSWKQRLSAYGLSSKNHCFCYKNPEGDTHSTCPVNENWSIASVTKVLTSLYLLDKYGADHRFETIIEIDAEGKKAHIKGGLDPVFQQSVVAYIIKELNHLGITSLNELSFDANFAFGVENYSENQNKALIKNPDYVQETAKWALNHYMNQPEKVSALLKKELQDILAYKKALAQKEAEKEKDPEADTESEIEEDVGVRSDLDEEHIKELEKLIEDLNTSQMSVANVIYKENADFEAQQRLSYKSAKLIHILKFFNTHSINGIGDYVFSKIGRENFRNFFSQYFNWSEPLLYNGSGLPYLVGSKRYENRISCTQVIESLEALEEITARDNYTPRDFLATSIKDGGTLKKRFLKSRYPYATSIWAKTGTINSVSAIAGFLESKKGRYTFALMGRGNVSTIKKFEESWLDKFVSIIGGLAPTPYTSKGFERIIGD